MTRTINGRSETRKQARCWPPAVCVGATLPRSRSTGARWIWRRRRRRREMTDRIWILGAPDPEMAAIESLLRDCGERVVYALSDRGERVTPSTAYRCPLPEVPAGSTVYAVECSDTLPDGWVRIDHHRPGEPGYGRPPAEFMAASSLGQVIAELARLGRLPEAWPRLGTSEGCTWHRGELVTRGGHPDQPGF